MNRTAREPLIGLAALMRLAFSGADLAPLGNRLIARAQDDPNDAEALLDLATLLQLRGNRDTALAVQAQALAQQSCYRAPTTRGPAAVRLLALLAPGDLMANTPLEFLLEDSDVQLELCYVAPSTLPTPADLPEHDLLFVAVGESAENRPLLQQLEAVAAAWPRPVINRPGPIARLSRDSVCAALASVPGVVMPVSRRIERGTLEQIGLGRLPPTALLEDGGFPVIVRPVDSHAGQGLAKLDEPAAIAGYLQAMPPTELYVSRFVDYRGRDGLFRKYRIALIDGQPFICHLAISEHWMIHYLNAGMAESAAKRAEEAEAMAGFDTGFAQRHREALTAVGERMELDYLGIDCAETADGRLLIFEVDSCMIVHALDPVDLFPYKQEPMRKLFAAFRGLLGRAVNA